MRVLGAAAFVLVLAAAVPARAELGWIGVHGAYYNEFDRAAIGMNAREVFGFSPVSVGFKGDYIFRPGRTSWSFEADLAYDIPVDWKRVPVWAGVGGGVLHDDLQGSKRATFEPLASAFVGAGVRQGPLLPYAEVRLTSSHDSARWILYLGLRF
jgi:hypothetical protein